MKSRAGLLVVLVFLVPSFAQTPSGQVSWIKNKTVCLDGVLLQRTVLPDKSLGPEKLGGATGECMEFAVGLPLTPEDAQLLEGKLPDDDALLATMSTEWGNAQELGVASQMSSNGQGKNWDRLMGAIWQKFEENRQSFCSRHPKMLVLKLQLDGTMTIPTECDKPEP